MLNVRHIPTIWCRHYTPRYLPKRKEAYVHKRLAHKSVSKTGKFYMPISKWLWHGINGKEYAIGSCYNADE